MAKLPKMPHFPEWLRSAAVRHEAERLWSKLPTEKDQVKAQKVLEQLISNPLMERVWDELYRKDPTKHNGFFNPACLTNVSQAAAQREEARELRKKGGDKNRRVAEVLEFEARVFEILPGESSNPSRGEQDRAAQKFLAGAYRAALSTEPELLSDIQAQVSKLRKAAKTLRQLAAELQSVGNFLMEFYAEQLEVIAAECDSDATVMTTSPTKDPWLITRKRGDLRLKTFVAKLSYTSQRLFMKTLHNTIANVANVVFGIESANAIGDERRQKRLTGENVRQMLRVNAQRIRPTFGLALMPMVEARKKEIEAELDSKYPR